MGPFQTKEMTKFVVNTATLCISMNDPSDVQLEQHNVTSDPDLPSPQSEHVRTAMHSGK